MFASWWEWGIVLFIVILLFGTKRLPELGAGLGKAIRNFKKSYRENELDEPKADSNNKE